MYTRHVSLEKLNKIETTTPHEGSYDWPESQQMIDIV